MNFMEKGRSVLAALLPLALVGPATADVGSKRRRVAAQGIGCQFRSSQ